VSTPKMVCFIELNNALLADSDFDLDANNW